MNIIKHLKNTKMFFLYFISNCHSHIAVVVARLLVWLLLKAENPERCKESERASEEQEEIRRRCFSGQQNPIMMIYGSEWVEWREKSWERCERAAEERGENDTKQHRCTEMQGTNGVVKNVCCCCKKGSSPTLWYTHTTKQTNFMIQRIF